MALKMAAMNRAVMEAIEEGSSKYVVLSLYRVPRNTIPLTTLTFKRPELLKTRIGTFLRDNLK